LFNVAASRPAQMTTERLNTSHRLAFRQDKPLVNRTLPSPGSAKSRNVFFAFGSRLT
jgi:hypothetical protein